MKKKYERPMAYIEEFTPDESVSACISGVIQCGYPGNGRTNGNPTIFDDYNGRESGWWYEDRARNMPHGICGTDTPITFSSNSASGYEVSGGKIDKNRPISQVNGYSLKPGTYKNVTWISVYNKTTYHHKGRLVIKNIDTNHPNHS